MFPAPWGAGLDHADGVVLLLEADPERAFGPALVLAASRGAAHVDLLAEGDAAHRLATTAAAFEPSPVVWRVDGVELTRAGAPSPESDPATPVIEAPIASLLERDDVEVVTEHGEVIAEHRGLEVARVRGLGVDQRLEIGVGAYDQGAFAVMHPELTDVESFDEVVSQVQEQRRPGAQPHPLNRLARERWLRTELLAAPEVLELHELRAVQDWFPRSGLRDQAPAFAVGVDAQGLRVLVVCSVGIDLSLVPHAGLVAARENADRIVLVLPARDHHRVTADLAEQLRLPCAITTANEPWPT